MLVIIREARIDTIVAVIVTISVIVIRVTIIVTIRAMMLAVITNIYDRIRIMNTTSIQAV